MIPVHHRRRLVSLAWLALTIYIGMDFAKYVRAEKISLR